MSCGNPHETDCAEVLDHIYEYLDGEMTPADVGKIRQHLDECGPCLAQHDIEYMLKALVRRGCGQESAPQTLRERIMVRITEIRVQWDG